MKGMFGFLITASVYVLLFPIEYKTRPAVNLTLRCEQLVRGMLPTLTRAYNDVLVTLYCLLPLHRNVFIQVLNLQIIFNTVILFNCTNVQW